MIETGISETNLRRSTKKLRSTGLHKWAPVADWQIHSHHFTSAVLPPFTWHKIELEIRWGSHAPTGFYSTVGQRLANLYRASLSIIQVLMQMN